MNKTTLINSIAEKTKLTKKDSEKVLNAFIETIMETLEKNPTEKIQLIGFGTFEVRDRAERQGVNPKTKEAITIPASKSPAFKPGKEFKERVNK